MAAGCGISLVSAALAGWLLIAVGGETPEARMQRASWRWWSGWRSSSCWALAAALSGELARQPLLFWMATAYVALLPLEVKLAIAYDRTSVPRHEPQAADAESPLEHVVQHPLIERAGASRPAHAQRQDHDLFRSDRDDRPGRPAADRAGAAAGQAPPRQERRRRDGAGRRGERARGGLRVPAQGSRRAGAAASTPIASSSTSGASSSSC